MTILNLSVLLLSVLHVASSIPPFHEVPQGREHAYLFGRSGSVVYRVELKKNVLLWEGLTRNGGRILSCVPSTEGTVRLELKAPVTLNNEKLSQGTVFVFDRSVWEDACGGISSSLSDYNEDPTMFLEASRITCTGRRTEQRNVTADLQLIAGKHVVPSIEIFQLPETHYSLPGIPSIHLSKQNFLNPGSTELSVNESVSQLAVGPLPSAEIETTTIFPGAKIETRGDLDASVGKITLKRGFSLEVEWEQSLFINFSSLFKSKTRYSATNTQNIYVRPISGTSFSARIPFLGTLRGRAFKRLDVLTTASYDESIESFVRASHEESVKVSAKLFSGIIEIDRLLPQQLESSGSSRLSFGQNTTRRLDLRGFWGYRAGIDIKLRLGSKTFDALTDIKVGLEMNTKRRFPPFRQLYSSADESDACGKCHDVRVESAVVGKDLNTRVFRDGKLRRKKTHLSKVFDAANETDCQEVSVC